MEKSIKRNDRFLENTPMNEPPKLSQGVVEKLHLMPLESCTFSSDVIVDEDDLYPDVRL